MLWRYCITCNIARCRATVSKLLTKIDKQLIFRKIILFLFHCSEIPLQTDTNYAQPSWLQFRIPCPQSEDWEEDIYGDLCYVTLASTLQEVGLRGILSQWYWFSAMCGQFLFLILFFQN